MDAHSEGGWVREGTGVWGQQVPTVVYRENRGPTVLDRDLCSVSCDLIIMGENMDITESSTVDEMVGWHH